MRAIFSIVGLLVTLMIVGLLAKKQLTSTQQAVPVLTVPAVTGSETTLTQPTGNVKQQSEQIQQQYKQALEQAMQARPDPDAIIDK